MSWRLLLLLSTAAFAAQAASCTRAPRIEERPIYVYSPRACPVSGTDAYSVVYGSGDFEPTLDRPPASAAFLRDVGYVMEELPRETRAVLVDISQREIDWRGFSDVPSKGDINVLVWPGGEACRLTQDVERRDEMTIGVVGRRILIAGGRSPDGSQVPRTYVGDLTTGLIERLPFGLNTRRSYPSITAFQSLEDAAAGLPSPALVAGGEDPNSETALSTAEIYLPAAAGSNDIGDFDRQRIDLSEARARHGAVVLVTGETLLVGGRSPAGPLRTMEIVDPVTRRVRTGGVAQLRVAREKPTVLRLASGEILVAGGFDATGLAVPTLEWFSPDASRATKRTVDLVTGRVASQGNIQVEERAIVPLEAGGALAVILPSDIDTSPDFKTVWVISADGTLEPGLPIDPATLETVRLYPGAEGAPALWTGQRWMRWSPWFGAFQAISDAPLKGCPNQAPSVSCTPGPTLDAIASGDPGLALWIDPIKNQTGEVVSTNIVGFRFATRTRFAAVPKPLLLAGPEQLAPDRLAGFPGSSIRFEAERGLILGQGASAFLTDVSFADFELDVDVTAGPATIVLRQENGKELEVGGAGCAFTQGATRRLVLKRRARRVLVSADDGPERTCPTELDPNTRVTLGLRGSQGVGVSGARNLRVTRR